MKKLLLVLVVLGGCKADAPVVVAEDAGAIDLAVAEDAGAVDLAVDAAEADLAIVEDAAQVFFLQPFHQRIGGSNGQRHHRECGRDHDFGRVYERLGDVTGRNRHR